MSRYFYPSLEQQRIEKQQKQEQKQQLLSMIDANGSLVIPQNLVIQKHAEQAMMTALIELIQENHPHLKKISTCWTEFSLSHARIVMAPECEHLDVFPAPGDETCVKNAMSFVQSLATALTHNRYIKSVTLVDFYSNKPEPYQPFATLLENNHSLVEFKFDITPETDKKLFSREYYANGAISLTWGTEYLAARKQQDIIKGCTQRNQETAFDRKTQFFASIKP